MQDLMNRTGGKLRLSGIYRVYLGKREGQKIWMVDGDKVCAEIYPEFLYGGNDQRYRFNPPDDIWIDNRGGLEELEYTVLHELRERQFMKEYGWTYDKAHDLGGIAEEKPLRARRTRQLASKQRKMAAVAREKGAVDLSEFYRYFVGTRKKVEIWVMDGPAIRKDLNPDFGFGNHGLKSLHIPSNEIWIDSTMSVEESYYSLLHQMTEHLLLRDGVEFEKAYEKAQNTVVEERLKQRVLSKRHEDQLPLVSYGARLRGVRPRKSRS